MKKPARGKPSSAPSCRREKGSPPRTKLDDADLRARGYATPRTFQALRNKLRQSEDELEDWRQRSSPSPRQREEEQHKEQQKHNEQSGGCCSSCINHFLYLLLLAGLCFTAVQIYSHADVVKTWMNKHEPVRAGGAVVTMSDGPAEWQEVLLKARPVMKAVAACAAAHGG